MEWSNGNITIKGDTSEMLDLFKGANANAEALLPSQDSRIKMKWFLFLSFIFLVLACVTWCFYDDSTYLSGIMSIVLIAMIAAIAITCHLSLKNKVATIITGFVSIVIYMVAVHLFTPEEAGKELKGKVDNMINSELQKKPEKK